MAYQSKRRLPQKRADTNLRVRADEKSTLFPIPAKVSTMNVTQDNFKTEHFIKKNSGKRLPYLKLGHSKA